ncbi:MAG: excinuclease ABC subunit UvrC [Deltaproteobacteria bacterium]|nr:excinuclease ABC subunit UvrC [Deltaproteobacteria bacterium]
MEQNELLKELESKARLFPRSPGVYLMKDKRGRIIYVGKAKNIRARLRQYFTLKDSRYHIQFLMNRLADLDFLQTSNEKEALLLENSLIKKHKPKYNLFLKDDKTYQGLKITLRDEFPRLTTTRRKKKDGAEYFGPFTSADNLYRVKEFIDEHFQLRTCSDHEFKNRTRPCLEYQIHRCSAPCVDYVSKQQYQDQIQAVRHFLHGRNHDLKKVVEQKMQQAADKEDYEQAAKWRDLLTSMSTVLEGQNVTHLSFDFVDVLAMERRDDKIGLAVLMVREGQLIDSRYHVFLSLEEDDAFLENFLAQYYSEQAFIPGEILLPFALENAEVIEQLLSERAGKRCHLRVPKRGEKRDLLKMAAQNLNSHFLKKDKQEKDQEEILSNLQSKLHMDRLPERIECFDISNISGKFAVASMVVFKNAESDSQSYRRFKIKSKDTPDDYAMMREALSRRFHRKTDAWQWPDLLLLDGGKGQLNMAIQVLEELNVVGVNLASIAKGAGAGARAKGLWDAKKEEEIFLPNRKNPASLRRGSSELMLLQQVRDEAHRFAITYHRKLREDKAKQSALQSVSGIGPKKSAALIKMFGSLKKLAEASDAELQQKAKLSPEQIRQIRDLS